MATKQIASWLTYWKNARMVALEEIRSLEDMIEARKWCSCMRIGVFSPDLVSTEALWKARQAV